MSVGFFAISYFILEIFFIFALMLLAHEGGHWLYFLLMKKKTIKLRFKRTGKRGFKILAGQPEDYSGLTKKEIRECGIWGILTGTIPFFLWMSSYGTILTTYPMLLLLIPYFIGCYKDILV